VRKRRAVIQFLTLKKLSARDITAELNAMYKHEAFSFGSEEVAEAVCQWENHPGR
jgi:hypothetical protein